MQGVSKEQTGGTAIVVERPVAIETPPSLPIENYGNDPIPMIHAVAVLEEPSSASIEAASAYSTDMEPVAAASTMTAILPSTLLASIKNDNPKFSNPRAGNPAFTRPASAITQTTTTANVPQPSRHVAVSLARVVEEAFSHNEAMDAGESYRCGVSQTTRHCHGVIKSDILAELAVRGQGACYSIGWPYQYNYYY
jgi:hypothetical protein